MMYCIDYQKLSVTTKYSILNSLISELKKVNKNNFPNIYAQLVEAESCRNMMQMAVNAMIMNDYELIEILTSIEVNLENA